MRVHDKPLPGDLVIRCRAEQGPIRRVTDGWIITRWPDADTTVAGPYQSYNYALQQAPRLSRDRSVLIWRDQAKPGEAERLELVAGAE